MIKKFLIPLLALLLSFSCSLSDSSNEEPKGSLNVSINRNNSRTILPDTSAIDIEKFVVAFSNGPESIENIEIDGSTFTGNKTIDNIPVYNEWTIKVTAYTEGKVFASQTKTGVNIKSGINTERFILKLSQDSKGNIDITLDWSEAGLNSSNALNSVISKELIDTATNLPISGNWDKDLILSSEKLTFNSSLNSGYYLLRVILGNGNEPVIPYIRMIHIYDNLLSIDEFGQNIAGKNIVKLTKEDFNSQPSAPTDLKATEGKKSIKLTWKPSSNNVLFYVVERKEGSKPWTVIAPKVEGTETYSDIANGDHEVIEGTTYKYRVKSVGLSNYSSEYSNETEGQWKSPEPGNSGKLVLSSTKTKELALNFAQATPTDNTDTYQVIYSDDATKVIGNQNIIENLDNTKWESYSTQPFAITDLTPNTEYYINVFVKDTAGNVSPYITETSLEEFKKKFTDKDGNHKFKTNDVAKVNIDISLEVINKVKITSSLSSITEHKKADDLTLSINEDFQVVAWYLNGKEISKSNVYNITGGSDLEIGINWITVSVMHDNRPYSMNFKIKVIQ